MSEQENFDELMRQKMSEREFPFSEANWEKAEAMIVAAEKKRKRRIIVFIFFFGVAIGIAFMLPFMIYESNDVMQTKQSISEKQSSNDQQQNKNVENNLYMNEKNTSDGKGTEQEQTTGNKKEINVEKDTETTTFVVEEKESKNKVNNNKPVAVEKKKEQSSTMKTQPVIVKRGKKYGETLEKNVLVQTSAEQATGLPEKETNKSANTNELRDVSKEQSIATENKNNTRQAEVVTAKPQADAFVDAVSVKKDSTIIFKLDSSRTGKQDNQPVAANENKQNDEPKKPKTYLSIDAGTDYCMGWQNNGHADAAGFNLIAGLSITHYFNTHWSILTGAQYNNLSHLNEAYSSVNTTYGFGFNNTYTVVTPKTLHYIVIPIKWQYNISPKNIVAAGLNIMHLVNTNSTIDTYTQSDFVTSAHSTTTKRGYMDGINPWDMQVNLAYRRVIYKNFMLGAEFYYGFLDIRNNNFFGNSVFDRNKGIKIILSYNFIK